MFPKRLQAELKVQQRIARSNSSSRYLENANSKNVFMYRYLCGIAEAVLQRCSVKKMFLKIFQNYRKTPALKSFLVKLQAREQHLYEIETPAQVLVNLREFLENPFCITYDYHTLHKIGVLKNLPMFAAKFLWTAASDITENIPSVAGCKFTDILQDWP